MDFNSKTVHGFFSNQGISFVVPEYQRAYSWEDLQLNTFYMDLLEHQNSGERNPYCYGNILLETIVKDRKFEIIDGQQRITTLSIFIRSLLNVIGSRIEAGEEFKNSFGEPIDVSFEEEIYFRSHGIIKLRPIKQDEGCYDTLIIENAEKYNCITPSQHRMLHAKKLFTEKLKNESSSQLLKLLDTVQNSIINQIELSGKKESALMFELQNNRGKELTNLEKLKSFLMYQLYVYSEPEETDRNIEYVSNQFNPIYSIINQMNVKLGADDEENIANTVNEDNILIYHSYAYSRKNFNYRNLNDIIEEFKDVPQEEKVDWIKKYALNLYTSFSNIINVLSYDDANLKKLSKMKMPFFVYPFIIKGANNKETLPELFRLMEVLSFRYKLVSSRSDIRGRLNDLIKSFNGNVKQLSTALHNKMEDAYYWGNNKVLEVLNGNMYKNSMINYFLWEYEQSLQLKGYSCGDTSLLNESIEHISPQTEPSEEVSSGYDVGSDGLYSKEFRENSINKLGNLMLISQSHNSSIGNSPFIEKLSSYIKNPLMRQQFEIKDFVKNKDNPVWDKTAIDNRHEKMLEFAKNRWSFL